VRIELPSQFSQNALIFTFFCSAESRFGVIRDLMPKLESATHASWARVRVFPSWWYATMQAAIIVFECPWLNAMQAAQDKRHQEQSDRIGHARSDHIR
jgi:hypothetical protein